MASIRLQGIKKNYDQVQVVRQLDLAIDDGEFIVLVGPSGCGKSTTLRMIAGLESISDGDLLIDGQRVNDLGPGDRDLAMVFQSYALYPHKSVRENIAFGLKVRGLPENEIQSRVQEVSKMLGLDELLDRKPAQLSGGQRQRVAMGRAIVRRPKAFLFDEPLSNLDAKLRTEVRAEIASLRRTLGTTTVYVTHDQVEAMTLADRVVVMNEGVAQQIGAPLEVYRKPANRFVAAFLGTPTMNFLDGQMQGSSFVVPGGISITLPHHNPQTSCLGIRPHELEASTSAEAPPDTVSLGELKVDLVERLGAESFVFGQLGETRVAASIDETLQVSHGGTLHLYCQPDNLHRFDADGLRLPND